MTEPTRRPIVAGVDGSDESRHALDWAVGEAIQRGSELKVVYVIPPWHSSVGGIGQLPLIDQEELETGARRFAEGMVERVRAEAPSLRVTGSALAGSPSKELLLAATNAEMLVLGSRGLGTVAGFLLGSVSTTVAVHATIPVVVVRGTPTTPTGQIVVGVDGSPASVTAVEFAVTEASHRGAAVTAIHVSSGSFPLLATSSEPQVVHRGEVDPAEAAAVAETLAGLDEEFPDVPVERIFMAGHPVPALVKASHGADLLVVGSRGHGAFTRMLLGSVSLGVIHLAPGPVAVVRQAGDLDRGHA